MLVNRWLLQNLGVSGRWKQNLLPPFRLASTAGQMPMDRGMQKVGGSVETFSGNLFSRESFRRHSNSHTLDSLIVTGLLLYLFFQ